MDMGLKKKSILLHSCCGPCSTAVIERLVTDYDVTVFFFNPNITDAGEYEHRKSEQIRFIGQYNERENQSVKFVEGDYDPEVYYRAASGFEQEREGGARCTICFRLRMEETARRAVQGGFDCFDTTLTVSPHKNYDIVSSVGRELSEQYHIEYVSGNYKKQDGFMRSVRMAAEYNLYRQNYCGCRFSERPEAQ